MPFFAALSTNPDTRKAIDELCTGALDALAGPADLALVFFSPHHAHDLELQAGDVQKRLGAGCLLGCSGASIVGNDQEIEQRPALSLWLARWARPMRAEPFHLTFAKAPAGDISIRGMPDGVAAVDPRQSAIMLLGEPSSFRADVFLDVMNQRFAGLPVTGGLASGGQGPGRLLLGDTMHRQGAVGVLLSGPCALRCLVSQPCRPIGKSYVVTRAKQNIIIELDGKPPGAQLQQLLQELKPRDQQLFQRGLHVGWAINPDEPEHGDLLVRNTLGLDRGSGALTINDRVRIGQTVQFLIRDPESADQDLRWRLQRELGGKEEQKPGAALLFTCQSRGARMFSQPHHDAGVLRAEVGNIPVAGFFAQGEIGPLGGRNFLHGFTASVALFGE